MTYDLRYYQKDAIDAFINYLTTKDGNPLAVLCGATGKSVVIAGLCKRAIEMHPDTNIIICVNSQELVEQNYSKLVAMAPELDIGLYSAGLGSRKIRRITFCGIQSVWDKGFSFPRTDLVIVDECDAIPKGSEGTWHKFFNDLKIANPYVRVCGTTATDYRMGQGRLCEGDGKFFDEVCYEYGILKAIEDGFVTRPLNHKTDTHYDVSKVGKRGGEFIESQLQAAVNLEYLNKACVDEIIEQGKDRKSWLAFCSGSDHAYAIRDEIRSRGVICETVTSKTPKAERKKILTDYKDGKIKCLTNQNILTVGFDHPMLDLIACLRPTGSARLWVQMIMRGFRLYEGKTNFKILDFSPNSQTFGAIDKIRPKGKLSSGEGDAPVKMCASCMSVVPASARICPDCGNEFEFNTDPKIFGKATGGALLSTDLDIRTLTIKSIHYYRHQKEGKPDSFKIMYSVREQMKPIYEWVSPQSEKARRKFEAWWTKRSNQLPPKDVSGCLELSKTLKSPVSISVRKVDRFDEILTVKFAEIPQSDEASGKPRPDALSSQDMYETPFEQVREMF